MTEIYHERYQRQSLIKGWDQKKLTNAKVSIIGNGYLGEFLSLGLVALGIGNIRIFSNEKNGKKTNASFLNKFKEYSEYKGNEKVKICASVLKKINKTVNIIGIYATMVDKSLFQLLNNPHIVIDTTNNSQSKLLCLEYCKAKKIPFISLAAGQEDGVVDINPDTKKLGGQFKYDGKYQNSIVSNVLTGFAIDEIRKFFLPLDKNESICKKSLMYSLTNENRFG